ncbi:MAG: vWA domain-containing protein [Patescibacteria group bacterium]
MSKLSADGMQTSNIGGLQAFKFSGIRTERLGAAEYTLATILIDVSGSVGGFENDLRKAMVTIVETCKDPKKCPYTDRVLLRVVLFSTSVGLQELHGFKPLSEIDPASYPALNPGGGTPLFDAVYSGVGATNAYGKQLFADNYFANGIVFIITDGMNNASTATTTMIRKEAEAATKGEHLESLVSVLVGINTSSCARELDQFRQDAGLTQYIDVGDVTRGKLAKLADFVSQSVSSQSQALGTGGPSQNIAPTI